MYLQVVNGGQLSPQASTNIIVFSPDVYCHRHSASILVKQLASGGCVVFCIEHRDEQVIGNKTDLTDELICELVSSRARQVGRIINLASDCSQLSKIFGENAFLCQPSIILAGHGFGANTALHAGGLHQSSVAGVI